MDRPDRHRFTKHTERLISPRAVGNLYQRAELLGRLPRPLQRWVVGRASSKDEQIGFVVEPYSFFLAYEVVDEATAKAQLPPDYELVPTAMFAGTEPRHSAILAAFNVHTSVFWGSRVEFYLIAENRRTGLLSWVICDYESNTISYDPGQGFSGSSTSRSVVTTTHAGEILVDVEGERSGNRIASTAQLQDATSRALDQRLWLEGNLSVDYGGRLQDPAAVPFGLIFDPAEVAQAMHLPLEALSIEGNTFGAGLIADAPYEACYFPFAQHYQTTSFPTANRIADREGLEAAALAIGGRTSDR